MYNSSTCLDFMQGWLKVNWQNPVVEWINKWRCKSMLKKMITMAAIFGLMYEIWKNRNHFAMKALCRDRTF